MTKTKPDLIRETLQQLNALGVGEAASQDDADAVDARIGPLLDDLAARNVIYVAGADEVPDSVFNALVMRLAEECAPKFGRPGDAGAIAFAERTLRTLARIGTGRRRTLSVDPAVLRRFPTRRGGP